MNALKQVGLRFADWLSWSQANQNAISIFDVKELYDAAYAEKAKARICLKTFKALLEKAEKLDAIYRAQMQADQVARFGKAA
ncbi:hypothetical protein [Mesorhizobium australicum]|uniref:Uncharacterized protein n=1 Tax=Mesorhizobium australicum TaxID=536018 RepID=A0A1X7N1E5_9HYPH|nr:hypothetical protein [Mesorhizobium australicum]SMH30166.1 hypothetical protein SAMN02982922_1009 [Mesorhizobium australicum]